MKKIIINDNDRRGKNAVEAVPLFLQTMRELNESEKEVQLVVPSVWSWSELPMQVIQFNMYELVHSLVVVFGKTFVFSCHYDHTSKELSIIARRIDT